MQCLHLCSRWRASPRRVGMQQTARSPSLCLGQKPKGPHRHEMAPQAAKFRHQVLGVALVGQAADEDSGREDCG
jgi:hypothetical protein